MERRRTARGAVAIAAATGVAVALLAAPAATAGTSAAEPTTRNRAADAAPAAASARQPDWAPCPKGTASGPTAALLECASVPVPLDHSRPDGPTIEIAISRLASTNPEERRGVLLTNPGGPGGSGLSMPVDLASLGLPASVLDRYDVIGVDPRGVGRSAPLSCGFTVEQGYNSNIPPYAANDSQVAARAEVAEQVAAQCAAHDQAKTLRHVSTANTARDLDLVRAALGEERISYYGISYGTALGSAYATLFPERTDRILLDSNYPDATMDRAAFRRFGLGMEQRFPDFTRYAAARSDTYEIGRTAAEVRRNYAELAARLDAEPVEGVTGAVFRMSVFQAMYADAEFPALAQLWQSLDRADAAGVRRQLERRTPALADAPKAEPSPFDNLASAQLAVLCNDSESPRDVAAYQRDAAHDRRAHPLFGGAAANITPCAFWPKPLEPAVEVGDDGPSNILLLQNLRDPASPAVGAKLLRKQLGDRARLVSIDQGGHGAYLYDDNPCGLDAATRFLVDGKRPATDRFCPASKGSGLDLDPAAARVRADTLARVTGR